MATKVKVSLEFDIEGVVNSYMSNGLTKDQAQKILKKFSEEDYIDHLLGNDIEGDDEYPDDLPEEVVESEVIAVPAVLTKKTKAPVEEPIEDDESQDDAEILEEEEEDDDIL